MRSLRYLNSVLTVIAVLLTLNLWTMWSATPGGEQLSVVQPAHAQGGVGGSAARQQEMLKAMQSLNKTAQSIQKTLTNGSARVRVEAGK